MYVFIDEEREKNIKRKTEPLDMDAVLKRKSKVQVVITAASISAFSLLIGAVLGYRFHRVRKLKHDVYYDVSGTLLQYSCNMPCPFRNSFKL